MRPSFASLCSHSTTSLSNSDIKLNNIGFDVRGDVKIFDFGLAKSLHKDLKTKDGLYHLTALTGSVPYMAPEVASGDPYNVKSDVYSFGILFWAILALKSPMLAFPSLKVDDDDDYMRLVVKGGDRPPIKSKWPAATQRALKLAWLKNIHVRPTMSQMCNWISTDLVKLTKEESIHQRTKNMMDTSWHSDNSAEETEAVLDIF